MKKITRISGVDCKIGRNSRTGSTISMIVPDEDIINVVSYFNDFKGGNEPTGKIKKIELVIYEDQDELETIEGLRAENKQMREYIDNLDTVVENSEALIDEVVVVEEEQTPVEPVEEKEHIPANQGDLKLYEKPCECEKPAFVSGKCANCGGVEVIPKSQKL